MWLVASARCLKKEHTGVNGEKKSVFLPAYLAAKRQAMIIKQKLIYFGYVMWMDDGKNNLGLERLKEIEEG